MSKDNRKNIIIINNKAFSLIELSIVLIIIGLLVAGVTGGKSLIDSARSRALINELREYERAVWTFRAARDRFPGDVRNRGIFGYWAYSSTEYKETDFPSDFITEFRKTSGNTLPNFHSALFLDLYIEGIIDFKPLGNSETGDKSSTTKAIPNSKTIDTNNVYLRYHYTGSSSVYSGTPPTSNKECRTGLKDFGSIEEALLYAYYGANATKGMNPKILKQVDLKLDDGLYWNGRVRASCFGKSSSGTASDTTYGYTDYDYAIENNKKCFELFYAL